MKKADLKTARGFIFAALLICLPAAMLTGQEAPAKMTVEYAEEPAVVIGGVKISLGDAIKQAVENNHDILSGSYDVAMTDTQYEKLQKKYALTLNADAGYKYQQNTPGSAILYGSESKTIDANLALQKSFSSGTSVSAGINNSYTDRKMVDLGTGFTLGDPKYHMPVLFASVRQELLKNGFGYSERRESQIAKNTAKIQKEQVLQSLSLVVVGVIVDYWTVVTNKTNLENSELQLAETRNVRNIIRRNVNLGLDDSFQLNYYNLLVAGAEASVISAKQAYSEAARNFLTTINLDEGVDLSGKVILSNVYSEAQPEEAIKTAYAKRADYKGALLSLENAKMQLDMAESSGLPSLTAELNVSTVGQDEEMASAYGQSYGADYPSLEGRVTLSYPIGDRSQKADERNAAFQLKQAEINLSKIKRTVKDDVVNKIEAMKSAYEIYRKASEARAQAELFYYKMLRNLRRGRLDSATVKNGLDAMVSGRQQEIEALVYYNISVLQLTVAKNELWERYGINVEDYIPKG